MIRRLFPALTLLLFLISCATAQTTPPASTEAGASPAESAPAPVVPSASTKAPPAARSASFNEVQNAVEARASASESFAPAIPGQTLAVGGEVRTGEDGRARLDLLPDGTVVRLAPNSAFTLAALEGNGSAPTSKIKLAVGKVWILLKGGSLEVQAPSGVASVRGSLLSVSFDPQTKTLTATCREGHCSLSDDDESIELTAGQAVDSFDGDIADEPRDMTDEELQEWEDEVPESDGFLDETPEATDVPTEVATEDPIEDPTEAPPEAPVDDGSEHAYIEKPRQ